MTNLYKRIFGITLIATLAGCAEQPTEEFDRILLATILSNIWSSECVVDGENSYLPVLIFSSDGVELFNLGTGSYTNLVHTANTECATLVPETVVISTFNYTLGNNITVDGTVEDITEATEIDFIDTTEESVDIGKSDFDIFSVKDKFTLYFGSNDNGADGSTATLRPTQLSGSVIYRR